MQIRVERLILCLDAHDAVTAKHVENHALHQGHALNEWPLLASLLSRGGRPVEIVQCRQQFGGEGSDGVLLLLSLIARGTLLIVLEVGAGSFRLGQIFIARLLGSLELVFTKSISSAGASVCVALGSLMVGLHGGAFVSDVGWVESSRPTIATKPRWVSKTRPTLPGCFSGRRPLRHPP